MSIPALKPLRPRLERYEQRAVIRLFQAAGCVVDVIDQGSKDRGSRRTAGVPDLWVFVFRRSLGLWWETKREGEKRSNPQLQFADFCTKTNTQYGWGGEAEAKEWLRQHGFILEGEVVR